MASTCGNGIIENGEECDCGYREDCKENCCYSASEDDESKRCRLKPNSQCSPSQGACCNDSCHFKSSHTECSQATDCMMSVNCTGEASQCDSFMKEHKKKDLTLCNHGTQLCMNGVINKIIKFCTANFSYLNVSFKCFL